MNSALRNRLIALIVSGASALTIAGVTTGWFEGTRYTPYLDPVGVLTVCEGHTGPDIIRDKSYTKAECAAFKEKDLAKADAVIDRYVKVPLSTTERAALIDFIFNVGSGNFSTSTLLRKVNRGDHAGACDEYKRWVYAGGRRFSGLEKRREVSEWLCEYK